MKCLLIIKYYRYDAVDDLACDDESWGLDLDFSYKFDTLHKSRSFPSKISLVSLNKSENFKMKFVLKAYLQKRLVLGVLQMT